MKLFLITRGSQGDVYPYFALATNLIKAGHEITISLPRVFEEQAKQAGFNYVLQNYDDINTLLEKSTTNRDLLAWMQRVTDQQFDEFIPILEKQDLLVSTNTEFSAPHIAEYCKKPIIRTAFAPFIPGRKIPPPVMPWPRPNPLIVPLLWGGLNLGVNLLTVGIINKNRKRLGMPLFKDQGEYAPSHAENFLMFSPSLGSVDPDWKYPWHIGGYCFDDAIPYEEKKFQELKSFVQKDDKPVLFFTMGSCKTKKKELICAWLLDICHHQGYKLVIGSGWWHTGEALAGQENIFLMDCIIPHNLVFSLCDGIIHHGGSGTTHSAARAGKPQMVLPIFVDQHYWGDRVHSLAVGPDYLTATHVTEKKLEKRVLDLMNNRDYKKNATALGEKLGQENGIQALSDYISRFNAR
ncbi:glycosyltransferase family 1, candidate beta-glycosyltransferase [Treponema primitia ZAS-2]|uniref:Glycosyltransferase family 1, candidate beta-glycosyltransferase n=1 Tax=Treponema primitia (strain ATCC BAA-887 / DSM 12427 / ZAS-2) TaxID=545694 RepID=F5YKL0_TREPZ|nr:glycosyltransferase [Treponema primitia]AEF85694.1 glycosyltransferase family 1, candidate beta-glycosyltransferase [Treponema primitia ZAS-2]